jgi:hypothetical protein
MARICSFVRVLFAERQRHQGEANCAPVVPLNILLDVKFNIESVSDIKSW